MDTIQQFYNIIIVVPFGTNGLCKHVMFISTVKHKVSDVMLIDQIESVNINIVGLHSHHIFNKMSLNHADVIFTIKVQFNKRNSLNFKEKVMFDEYIHG